MPVLNFSGRRALVFPEMASSKTWRSYRVTRTEKSVAFDASHVLLIIFSIILVAY
jgi:hypothetical protein